MADKDLYREKFEAKLREIKARIELLEARAAQVKTESKLEYQRHLDELRQKREVLRGRLDEIKSSGGEAWKDIRAGIEKAADDLRQAVDKAMDKFR
jgi:hypothetical protein